VSAIGSSHGRWHEVEYFGARLANGVSAAAFKRQTTIEAVCLTSQKAQELALRYQSSRCNQQSLSRCFNRREG
jgi:hypothetical protein